MIMKSYKRDMGYSIYIISLRVTQNPFRTKLKCYLHFLKFYENDKKFLNFMKKYNNVTTLNFIRWKKE